MSITKEQREVWRAEAEFDGDTDYGTSNAARILALLDDLDAAVAERDPSDAEVPVTNEERDRWRRIVESQRHDISDLAGQLERSSRDAAYHQTLAELAESERDEAVAKVARVEALADEWACMPAWTHGIAYGNAVEALRAALDTPATDEGGEGA